MSESMDYTGFNYDDFTADALDAAADEWEERQEALAEFFGGDEEEAPTDAHGNVREWCGCGMNFIDEDLGICWECYKE